MSLGAGGSRLLRGNCEEHEALEAEATRFFRAGTSLFFGSGYIANYSVLTTLPQRGDLLVLDALVHASIHEGARAGRASHQLAGHNEPQVVEDTIRRWRAQGGIGRVWIAVESLYSMDGDFCPLEDLVRLADRYDAFLVIDEAHATGVYGDHGRGLAASYEGRDNLLVVHTCGKALGAAGALVTTSGVLRNFILNRCRPVIFATAPSPLMAVAVREALVILQNRSLDIKTNWRVWSRSRTGKCACAVGEVLRPHRLYLISSADNARTMQLASRLQARSFDIRGIRPPTVPDRTARLRISLTLNVVEDDVRAMLDALFEETTGEAR